MNHFNNIPTLDMRELLHRDARIRAASSRRLCEICHDVGFFYLSHHGIASELTHAVLEQSRLFFALPQHEKNKIDIYNSPHYRGYGKLQAETTKGIPDYKETYDLGIDREAMQHRTHPYQRLHGPNQWPPHVNNNFISTINSYIHHMLQLGYQIMLAVAEGLEIDDANFVRGFDPASDDAYAMLRLLHYPPAPDLTKLSFGVGPHVDAGCLVFLLQDDVGGLQVQNHNGDWIDAPPQKDCFIVNIGEMLQLWTNGYFSATPHRVLNHQKNYRISAPFFFEPNLSTVVKPIHQTDRGSIQHSGLIYGEHMLNIFRRSFIEVDCKFNEL